MQVTVKDPKGSKSEDEPPPMWFSSYMEKVKFYSKAEKRILWLFLSFLASPNS